MLVLSTPSPRHSAQGAGRQRITVSQAVLTQLRSESSYFFLPPLIRCFLFMLLIALAETWF